MTPTGKTIASFGKFLFWFAVAAVVDQIIENIGNLNIPPIYVPIAAAAFKALATYVATVRQEK